MLIICIYLFQTFVWTYVFRYLGCIRKSEIVGSDGNTTFEHFKEPPNSFHNGCTVLHILSHDHFPFIFWLQRPSCRCYMYLIVCMYHSFFIHSSVSEHLGCFQVLAIVNCAAISNGVCVSFRIMIFPTMCAQ